MLTKKLACPSCGVHLKVADTLPAGKVIKCPKCSNSFPVPDDDDEPLKVESEPAKGKDPIRLVESAAAKSALAKRRKPTPPPDDDEAPDGEKKLKRGPSKRRKKRKQTSSNTPLVVGLVIVGAVLVIGAGVAFLVWRSSANKNAPLAQNEPAPRGPRMAPSEGGRPRGPRGPMPAASNPEPPAPQPEARPEPSAPVQVAQASSPSIDAQALFERNCTRCHSSGGGGGPGRGRGGRGPNLSRIGAKRSADWLTAHIRNPQSHNPNSRMPAFEDRLSEDEMRSLAEYLANMK